VLYAVAVKGSPATTVDLLAALEQQNPKSKYLDQAYANYLYALSQSGGAAKIPAIAEKALVNFPENGDLLLFLADYSMSQKQGDRAVTLANRLVGAMSKQPKPEGVADADWAKRRNTALGRGYWIAGVISGEKNQYVAADKNLRSALPLVKGNDAMTSRALFYLGVANYNLGKMTLNKAKVLDGAKFSDQCAAIPGPLAEQAWKNSALMKTDAGRMR
jgi:tetratricopeptide (TPR) repeat protein